MPYTDLPWTLTAQEPKIIKVKREEMQSKKAQSNVEESLPVSVARIVKFLNKNKNQKRTRFLSYVQNYHF